MVLAVDPSQAKAEYEAAAKALCDSHVALIQASEGLQETLDTTSAELEVLKTMQAAVHARLLACMAEGDFATMGVLADVLPGGCKVMEHVPARPAAPFSSPSILCFNGRSLDSQNPWHLQMSYEAQIELSENPAADLTPPSQGRIIFDPAIIIGQTNNELTNGNTKVAISSPNISWLSQDSKIHNHLNDYVFVDHGRITHAMGVYRMAQFLTSNL